MAAIELYTPQGAEMVSGMMYEPYEQGVIMRLEHHLVGGYVRYISPYIILLLCITSMQNLQDLFWSIYSETNLLLGWVGKFEC